jgi:hypothetical protein
MGAMQEHLGKRARELGVNASRRRATAHCSLLLLCLTLAGCKTAGFKETFMALDGAGNRRREHFFVDTEEIHCIGTMASGVNDVTVTGVLRAQQLWDPRVQQMRKVDAFVATEELAPGAGKDLLIDFKVEPPTEGGPFRAGEYTCELSIDGELEATVPFDIAFPECPAAPVSAGGLCEGFVLPGSRCPSSTKSECICAESGNWECS